VWRPNFQTTKVRARVEPEGHVRLGTLRLAPERALPGTIGVLLELIRSPRGTVAEVEDLLDEGPAALAGLLPRDQVLEIDGRAVAAELAESLLRGRPGTTVTVKVRRHLERRHGDLRWVRPRTVTLTIERAPGRRTRRRHPIWRA
jgi:C-terminal processing protease CtpA/Prc